VDDERLAWELRNLMDEYRARCLWFLREDYYPQTPAEMDRVLALIVEHGDREALHRAAVLRTPRLSRDVDVFHDTEEAVARSWERDRVTLREHGYRVDVVRERAGYVEAIVRARGESLLMEWARDSAFRFFPPRPARTLVSRRRASWPKRGGRRGTRMQKSLPSRSKGRRRAPRSCRTAGMPPRRTSNG
jgi:hypothetical protein